MKIYLTKQEIRHILSQRFGEAEFRVFYTESDSLWESRNNKRISEMTTPPEKQSMVLFFDE